MYLGVIKSTGQQYAIKSIEKSQLGITSAIHWGQEGTIDTFFPLGDKEWENLCREIEILRQLNHPNVIRMHSIFQSPQQYHIVLD